MEWSQEKELVTQNKQDLSRVNDIKWIYICYSHRGYKQEALSKASHHKNSEKSCLFGKNAGLTPVLKWTSCYAENRKFENFPLNLNVQKYAFNSQIINEIVIKTPNNVFISQHFS